MKLKTLIQEIAKETAALEFLSSLVKRGPFKNKVFLAGGSPRDMQLGMKPKDLDVVVKGGISAGIDFAEWAAKEIGNYKAGSNPVIFPTYGTAKFTLQGVNYMGHDLSDVDVEAVAPRKEKYTPGSRKPEVSGGELEDDVQRRDFTVNSLLHDLTTGEVLDLTGMGKEDIKSGIVRTPLDPDIIFTDDPLRILRAVRFTAKYNWKLPMFMIRAIKKNASQLTNISKERIHDEANKMLLTDFPFKAFRMLQIFGLMKYVFPSLSKANLDHMKKMKELKPILALRLIATHAHNNPNTVQAEMTELRYSLDIIKIVINTLKQLPEFMKNTATMEDEYLRKLAYFSSDVASYLFAYGHVYAENFNVYETEERYGELADQIKQNPLPVTGNDLVALGMKPSPEFKRILDTFKAMYIKNPLTPREEYLKLVRR
jgi:tRNA nucleotidyltransferase/poly(A) polymerase